mmetsp:Transcript_9301/g.16224  ORF Transcript_9301/g.16224 Transcript_9301/m.16224 type:complete len:96 (-) Transcript_9301:263-550(-)
MRTIRSMVPSMLRPCGHGKMEATSVPLQRSFGNTSKNRNSKMQRLVFLNRQQSTKKVYGRYVQFHMFSQLLAHIYTSKKQPERKAEVLLFSTVLQ